jgi:hypothetical protein
LLRGWRRAWFAKRLLDVSKSLLNVVIEAVDEAVIGNLVRNILHPAAVQSDIDEALNAMHPRTAARNAAAMRAELQAIDQELANLAQAIATGGQLTALLTLMKDRQQRRDELAAHLAARADVSTMVSRRAIEAKLYERLKTWQARLSMKNMQEARHALRELLIGPI